MYNIYRIYFNNDKMIYIDRQSMYKHDNIIINKIRYKWILDLCELIFNMLSGSIIVLFVLYNSITSQSGDNNKEHI